MKSLSKILFVGLTFFGMQTVVASEEKISPDCTFRGFKLYGKVQIVEHFPDLKVEVVKSFPDLKVKWVNSFPDSCGKWQKVQHFPDLKIQFVKHFPDIKIKLEESFPGLP